MSVISRLTSVKTRLSSCISRNSIRHETVRHLKKKSYQPPEPENNTKISKYLIYSAVVIPVSFGGCMIWQYENIRKLTQKKKVYEDYTKKEFGFRDHINGFWNSVTPGKKFVMGLISVNVAVFLLWKVAAVRPLVAKYFLSMPTKAHSIASTTLSAFSHYSGFHLLVNMYVLWSFTNVLLPMLGKEQFFAVYLSAATFSSAAGCIFKVATGRVVGSLGASGAILSLIAIVCYQHPDARLSIALVDQLMPHSFSARTALVGIILLDTAGIIFGWRLFDHTVHLAGVMFGLLYAKYGQKLIWEDSRRRVLHNWHKIRNVASKE